MSDKILSDAELQAIRGRNEKRTPGEWRVLLQADKSMAIYVGKVDRDGRRWPWGGTVQAPEDMAFIAACSADIPRLLATVEALQKQNAQMREALVALERVNATVLNIYGEKHGLNTDDAGYIDRIKMVAAHGLGRGKEDTP